MILLEVSNIAKTYPGRETRAVEGISFTLGTGEILAVVGENGSGKTTLLKLIQGLEDADEGTVTFRGEQVTGPSYNLVPGHPQIKMLAQNFQLFPKHTVRENIAYNLRMLSEEGQSSRVGELIRLCRLEGMEDKLPSELSGGQQQRVALAKAIADNPPLLLMDEPFSNLDLFLKDEIKRKVIQKIREEKNSAIFVTHDLKDALSLADRIAVVKDGSIMQLDTPQIIYEKPANEYIAYLFGKVNILPAPTFATIFGLTGHKKFSGNTKGKASIRPEHIQITKEDKSQARGIVQDVYYMGDSYELDVKLGKTEIRVSTRKKQLRKGDHIYLKVSATHIHMLR